jgi:hypothetical protein
MAVVAILGAAGCCRPIRISIAQAREQVRSLRGGLVRVDGSVRKFTDERGDYYVLEDADRNRMGLAGRIEPLLPPLADRSCRVTGVLSYEPGRGFYLLGRSVEPAP